MAQFITRRMSEITRLTVAVAGARDTVNGARLRKLELPILDHRRADLRDWQRTELVAGLMRETKLDGWHRDGRSRHHVHDVMSKGRDDAQHG